MLVGHSIRCNTPLYSTLSTIWLEVCISRLRLPLQYQCSNHAFRYQCIDHASRCLPLWLLEASLDRETVSSDEEGKGNYPSIVYPARKCVLYICRCVGDIFYHFRLVLPAPVPLTPVVSIVTNTRNTPWTEKIVITLFRGKKLDVFELTNKL